MEMDSIWVEKVWIWWWSPEITIAINRCDFYFHRFGFQCSFSHIFFQIWEYTTTTTTISLFITIISMFVNKKRVLIDKSGPESNWIRIWLFVFQSMSHKASTFYALDFRRTIVTIIIIIDVIYGQFGMTFIYIIMMVGFNWLLSQREGMTDTCLNCYIICSQTYTHTHIDNEPICCCWLYYLTWIQWSTNFYFLFIFTHSQYCIYSKNLLFSFFVPVIFKFFSLFFGSVNNWIITFDVLMMTCDVLSLILIRFFFLTKCMNVDDRHTFS